MRNTFLLEQNNHNGFLYINDGSIGNSAPGTLDPLVEGICLASGSVVAELHDIPNEPITFAGRKESLFLFPTTHQSAVSIDGISRSEDAIIA